MDEGKREEQLDYNSSPEWDALEGGTLHSQLCSVVHMRPLVVMRYSFSFFTYSHFFVLFADFLAHPCLFSSFVASDTNNVD